MQSAIAILCFMYVHVTALYPESSSIINKEHGKALPSRTILERDGQYLRLIGPFYAKVEVTGIHLPLAYWKPTGISAIVTPTVDFPSLFVNGLVTFEGSTLYSLDSDVDLCIDSGLRCPFFKGVSIQKSANVSFGDLGLFPGLYQAYFDIFTTDRNQEKFKAGRVELKLKVLEN